MPNLLAKLREDKTPASPTDTIKSTQTNTALIATVSTTLTAIVTLVNPELLMRILGESPSSGARATLAVGILAAGGLVASADLFARAYSAKPRSGTQTSGVSPLTDSTFKLLEGEDTPGWKIIAVIDEDAIIMKSGETPKRVAFSSLKAE